MPLRVCEEVQGGVVSGAKDAIATEKKDFRCAGEKSKLQKNPGSKCEQRIWTTTEAAENEHIMREGMC